MKRFKEFLSEARRERVAPQPMTLYHGTKDYWGPNLSPAYLKRHPTAAMVQTGRGDFHMTTDPRLAIDYALE
jgi:radical SAM superfamily enzyme YgiQ (UPF0313 family)